MRNKRLFRGVLSLLIAVVTLAIGTLTLASEASPTEALRNPTKFVITPLVLGTIPQSAAGGVVTDARGDFFGCPLQVANQWLVASNIPLSGGTGSRFDQIMPDSIRFAAGPPPLLAYVAGQNGKFCAVVSGKPGQLFDEIIASSLRASSSGCGYFARSGNRWCWVSTDIDSGKSYYGQGYEFIRKEEIAWSADRRNFAYIVQRDGKWAVVNFGVVDKLYDDVRDLRFWPESTERSPKARTLDHHRLVHVAKIGSKWSLVVVKASDDGLFGGATMITGPPTAVHCSLQKYDEIGTPVISPDYVHIAYPASVRGKWSVMLFGPPPSIPNGPASIKLFAPDGQEVWSIRNGVTATSERTYLEQAIGKPADRVGNPVYSSDGKHLAYAVCQAGKWSMVLDEKTGDAFDEVGTPVVSAQGEHLYYTARMGTQWCVVTDGKAGSYYDAVSTPVLSASGEHVAYAVKTGNQWCMVRDGRIGKAYDLLRTPVFSRNGTHFAYQAKAGNSWRVVCDDLESPPYVAIIDNSLNSISDYEGPRTTGAGTIVVPTAFQYVALRETAKTYENGEKALEVTQIMFAYAK